MSVELAAVEAPVEQAIPPDQLRAEVQAWAQRIQVQPREIRIRPMNSKWASCSSAGRLTFNSEMLSQSTAFRSEVIAHELLHLKVPNHGKLFKALLRAYLLTATEGSSDTKGERWAR